jgi:transcriptional regulator
MYTPAKFKVDDPAVIRSFIEKHPFGLLLSIEGDQILDTHTPFVLSENGQLLGHVARANPQWKAWSEANRVKVIFTGPHACISPKYYVSEFAVPTWNYTAVSISGRVSIIEHEDEVLRFLDLLVSANEKSDEPWELDRTDERYMKLLSGIVVFSVSMDSVEASFKMNQNKSEEDQRKVIDSLAATDCPMDQEVAEIMFKNVQCLMHQK